MPDSISRVWEVLSFGVIAIVWFMMTAIRGFVVADRVHINIRIYNNVPLRGPTDAKLFF